MKDCTDLFGHGWVDHDQYLPTEWDTYDFVAPPIPYPVAHFKGWTSTLVHCVWCDEVGYRIEAAT